jgi:hypothetical protein
MTNRRCLKLRAGTTFVAVDNGVLLRNSRGSYIVMGKGAYALIRRLFALLDGSRTTDQICGGLSGKNRAVVERQLAALIERGFVKPLADDRQRVPPWASDLYGEQLEFLDDVVEDPWPAFLVFRRQRILCVGSGLLLRSLLVPLAEYGAADVCVLSKDSDDRPLDELLRALAKRDAHSRFFRGTDSDLASLEQDVILVALERDQSQEVARLCKSARANDIPVGVVLPIGRMLLAASFLRPSACWCCTYRSLFIGAAEEATPPPPTAMALACNHLVHALFLHSTGASGDAAAIATVDSDSLVVRLHRMPSPHPACERHGRREAAPWGEETNSPVRPDLPSSNDSSSLGELQNSIALRISGLVDKVVGPLIAVGEDDLPQLPLSACRCVARALSSTPARPDSFAIVCRGPSARESRNQATLFAIERLARGVVDQPGIATGAGWSSMEARYRALLQLTLDWAHTSAQLEAVRPFSEGNRCSALIADYFLETLSSAFIVPTLVAYAIAPTGFTVARLVTSTGDIAFGAGVALDSACTNALSALACAAVSPPSVQAELVPAILMLGAETWRDVLEEATARRSVDYVCLDGGPLLPGFAEAAAIALVRADDTRHVTPR